jgi:Trypsin-like peptidase domain
MKFTTLIALSLGLISGRCLGVTVDQMSLVSLYLFEPFPSSTNGLGLAGTGFVVSNGGTNYLISNWHVFSGRDWPNTNSTDPKGSFPTNVIIFYNSGFLGKRVTVSEPLYDTNGVPLWLEDKSGGTNIDVAALPLTVQDDHAKIDTLNLAMADVNMQLSPAMSVSIIGFPGNLTAAGDLPVWKTGNIASDPDVDYRGKPLLLVSAVTRKGMSGSPVIARTMGSYIAKGGGVNVLGAGITDDFVGIFSAYQPDNEITFVWKARIISDILEHGQRGTLVIKQ